MLRKPIEHYEHYDINYPDFIKWLSIMKKCHSARLPLLRFMAYRASRRGIVWVALHLMGVITKFKVSPNNPNCYYCNVCEGYFTPEDWDKPIWWHELIAVESE